MAEHETRSRAAGRRARTGDRRARGPQRQARERDLRRAHRLGVQAQRSGRARRGPADPTGSRPTRSRPTTAEPSDDDAVGFKAMAQTRTTSARRTKRRLLTGIVAVDVPVPESGRSARPPPRASRRSRSARSCAVLPRGRRRAGRRTTDCSSRIERLELLEDRLARIAKRSQPVTRCRRPGCRDRSAGGGTPRAPGVCSAAAWPLTLRGVTAGRCDTRQPCMTARPEPPLRKATAR